MLRSGPSARAVQTEVAPTRLWGQENYGNLEGHAPSHACLRGGQCEPLRPRLALGARAGEAAGGGRLARPHRLQALSQGGEGRKGPEGWSGGMETVCAYY